MNQENIVRNEACLHHRASPGIACTVVFLRMQAKLSACGRTDDNQSFNTHLGVVDKSLPGMHSRMLYHMLDQLSHQCCLDLNSVPFK